MSAYCFGVEADLLGEVVRPGFQELAVAVEDGDARAGRAGGDVDAVLAVEHDGTAEAVLHAGRAGCPRSSSSV